jgi:hypothetical protein
MQCAYTFACLGGSTVAAAFTGNVWLVLVGGSISGYFLQLVFLPVLGVEQRAQSAAADKRSQQVFDDVEMLLHGQAEAERHMQHQDELIGRLLERKGCQ